MKKVFRVLLICSGLAAPALAAEKSLPASGTVAGDPSVKIPIEISALPEQVITLLASETYTGWYTTAAWLITGASTYYEIELTNRDEEITLLKLDNDGKAVL